MSLRLAHFENVPQEVPLISGYRWKYEWNTLGDAKTQFAIPGG